MPPTTRELVQLGQHQQADVGELLHRISDDMRTLASDEVELARVELSTNLRGAVAEAAVVIIGAVVGLIGMGLLCLVAVAALEPVISSLALRLLLMSLVYLAIGGVLAGVFARKLKREANQAFAVPVQQAKDTVAQLKGALTH